MMFSPDSCVVCGCEPCMSQLFGGKVEARCPACGAIYKKTSYRKDEFLDTSVQKQDAERKRVYEIYNKTQADFPTLRAYNDYLEMVEDIVFNLVNDVNAAETRRQMEEYRQRERETITRNQALREKQERQLQAIIEEEKKELRLRQEQYEEEERALRELENQEHEDMLADVEQGKSVEDAERKAHVRHMERETRIKLQLKGVRAEERKTEEKLDAAGAAATHGAAVPVSYPVPPSAQPYSATPLTVGFGALRPMPLRRTDGMTGFAEAVAHGAESAPSDAELRAAGYASQVVVAKMQAVLSGAFVLPSQLTRGKLSSG